MLYAAWLNRNYFKIIMEEGVVNYKQLMGTNVIECNNNCQYKTEVMKVTVKVPAYLGEKTREVAKHFLHIIVRDGRLHFITTKENITVQYLFLQLC